MAELIAMAASDDSSGNSPVVGGDTCVTKVSDLLRFWNPEFLQHQLEHASVMDELPAVKVRLQRVISVADERLAEIEASRSLPQSVSAQLDAASTFAGQVRQSELLS